MVTAFVGLVDDLLLADANGGPVSGLNDGARLSSSFSSSLAAVL